MQDYGHYGMLNRPCRRNLKEMVDQGITPIGMALAIPSAFMVDIAAVAGFDYVWVDLEHNVFNPETVTNIIRAADAAGMPTMARIAQMDLILPLLDFGMVGFTVPHVRNAQQAREIVDAVKYAPIGNRGFSTSARAMRFGAMPFKDYMEEIRKEVTVTVIIEDNDGIKNVEEILDVPGIDYLGMGPGDISQALGHIGDVNHPDCIKVRDKLTATADKRGIKHYYSGAPINIAEDKVILLSALTNVVQEYRAKQ